MLQTDILGLYEIQEFFKTPVDQLAVKIAAEIIYSLVIKSEE